MTFAALSMAFLLSTAAAQMTPEHAELAQLELENIRDTSAMLVSEARWLNDDERLRMVAYRHARVEALVRAMAVSRERLERAADETAAEAASAAMHESLMGARRLLGESAGPFVMLHANERTSPEGALVTVTRVEHLHATELALAEMVAIEEWLRPHHTSVSNLLLVSEDAARTMALTDEWEAANHEFRKVHIALAKSRQLASESKGYVTPSSPLTRRQRRREAACERTVERFWTDEPRFTADLNRRHMTGLEYWEPDWWEDYQEADIERHCSPGRS